MNRNFKRIRLATTQTRTLVCEYVTKVQFHYKTSTSGLQFSRSSDALPPKGSLAHITSVFLFRKAIILQQPYRHCRPFRRTRSPINTTKQIGPHGNRHWTWKKAKDTKSTNEKDRKYIKKRVTDKKIYKLFSFPPILLVPPLPTRMVVVVNGSVWQWR